MIITCPNCQTRYKLGSDALSAAGRQVQCAACSELWYATPSFPGPSAPRRDPEPTDDELIFRADTDTLFSAADEEMLDASFLRNQPARQPAEPGPEHPFPNDPAPLPDPGDQRPPIDSAANQARIEALARRRNGMLAAHPIARFRRMFRFAIIVLMIASVVAAFALRTEIVSAIPQLDGLYRLVGLKTNVVGLDFTEIKTLRTTQNGNPAIVVNAKISNITNRITYVPSVLVSLLDSAGTIVYEWTVTPATRNVLPGDTLAIDAQLIGPPQGVTNIRLSFVDGANGSAAGN
ncbi:zinc-ribbon domain-containing protein [Pelagibacterium flavum]|uniref:Zinc-ribbon domain-containing protein n=1 Tax=Pelagibacterium flavum TaxID=2984530 RepID=A0ABY6IQ74_9HYPH|nr:zinc-ribbon domain-containing protein [Pelagibacterium sp. YIM 151497]UYQ72760.1 zinc-ribbon domain-containing protein [Pelagibacterium sp. YIM 151497]